MKNIEAILQECQEEISIEQDYELRKEYGLKVLSDLIEQRNLETGFDWSVGIVNSRSEANFALHMMEVGVNCFYPQSLEDKRVIRGKVHPRRFLATFPGYVFVKLDKRSPEILHAKRFNGFQRFLVLMDSIFIIAYRDVLKMESLQRGGFFNRSHLPTFGLDFLRLFPVNSVVRMLAGQYDGYLGIMRKGPENKGDSAIIDILGEEKIVNPLDVTQQIY